MSLMTDRRHHLAGAMTHMASRLSDHIERIDEGNVAAVDDLAVTLRSLVGSGKGNQTILAACRAFEIDQPTVQVSRSPITTGSYLSIGSIPVEEPGAISHGARELRLSKWTQEPVLRCSTKSGSTSYSWDKFIREYANKWGGAHFDHQVPDEMFSIDRHAAAGLVMSTYLLRTAGVAVWKMAQGVLSRALRPDLEGGATFSAPGSTSPRPDFRKQHGQLQWLTLGADTMDMGWYVDHFSESNTLRLAFGRLPYDIRYQANGAPQNVTRSPVILRGPRSEQLESPMVVDPNRRGSFTGIVIPIQQLQGGIRTDGEESASGPE